MARKRVRTVLADEAVRVVLSGEEQKLDAARVGRMGQGAVQRLAGRTPPGAVAVKTEHHRVGKPQQLLHMLGRTRSAQRGHRVRKAQLRQRHHVHVALGDECVARLADGRAGLE